MYFFLSKNEIFLYFMSSYKLYYCYVNVLFKTDLCVFFSFKLFRKNIKIKNNKISKINGQNDLCANKFAFFLLNH